MQKGWHGSKTGTGTSPEPVFWVVVEGWLGGESPFLNHAERFAQHEGGPLAAAICPTERGSQSRQPVAPPVGYQTVRSLLKTGLVRITHVARGGQIMGRHAPVPFSGFVIIGILLLVVAIVWFGGPRPVASPDLDPPIRLAAAEENARPVTTTTPTPPTRPTSGPLEWPRPRFKEYQADRDRMVRTQIAESWDGRDRVTDPGVLAAMRNVPRHLFVEKDDLGSAHADHPLPIGYGQTISQPYIVALMTEALRLRPGAKVLEIGTGSGYQAAVLNELTPHVWTIEIIGPLYKRAAERLDRLGYKSVRCKHGDGYWGWPEHAPFDGIIVTCAAGHVPPPLFDQLAPGGRMVIPIGQPGMYQQLKVVTKDPKTGRPNYQTICGVAFVPMVGRMQNP